MKNLILLLLTFFSCSQNTDVVQRIEKVDRENLYGIDDRTDNLLNTEWAKQKRLKNTHKHFRHFIEVVKDIKYVNISRTNDTYEYVIEITDSKGNEASIWMKGNEVRAITPY